MRATHEAKLPDRDMPTVEQIRHTIDRGGAHDKVRVGDPAAAPLGADEEAAGTPTTADRLKDTCANEFGRMADNIPKRRNGAALFATTMVLSVALAAFAVALGG